MIKLIKKFFTGKDSVNDSTLEVIVELPKKSREELFDDAVMEVVKQTIHKSVKIELIEMCYERDVIIDTNKAIDFLYGKKSLDATYDELITEALSLYPKAKVHSSYGFKDVGLSFNIDLFIMNIVNEALNDK